MNGKQAQLSKKWADLADRVAEWAYHLQQTTPAPDIPATEAILHAHHVVRDLRSHISRLANARQAGGTKL